MFLSTILVKFVVTSLYFGQSFNEGEECLG